ncbi:MAG: transposase [Acidimicrobiia bacterium]|nr:transposase [Acidimicrobiia bacterium]
MSTTCRPWRTRHSLSALQITANNLIKRIKRVAFGFTNFRNYRVRVLLYAGKPNWDLLASVTPR